MNLFALCVFVFGLALALNTASCSDLNNCAASGATGGSSCVAGNASGGSAGSAGAASTTTCDQFTALQDCLTPYCKAEGSGSPFCVCFLRDYDLAPNCHCGAKIDGTSYCQQTVGQSIPDCSIQTSQVATMCVGVQ